MHSFTLFTYIMFSTIGYIYANKTYLTAQDEFFSTHFQRGSNNDYPWDDTSHTYIRKVIPKFLNGKYRIDDCKEGSRTRVTVGKSHLDRFTWLSEPKRMKTKMKIERFEVLEVQCTSSGGEIEFLYLRKFPHSHSRRVFLLLKHYMFKGDYEAYGNVVQVVEAKDIP